MLKVKKLGWKCNKLCKSLTLDAVHKRTFFGSTKSWNLFESDLIQEDESFDNRVLTMDEIREHYNLSDMYELPGIPELELSDNMWFTDDHMFIQQTDLDNVWRIGLTPIKFIYERHVEWLEFEEIENRDVLFSQALMWYAIARRYPKKNWPQAMWDVQYTLQSPFHIIKVLSYNKRIYNEPRLLIDNREKIDYKWCVTFKWTSNSNIFDNPPLIEGRHGSWYDKNQYLEYVKNDGLYKDWQLDEISKLYELGQMNWKLRQFGWEKQDKMENIFKKQGNIPSNEYRKSKLPKYLSYNDDFEEFDKNQIEKNEKDNEQKLLPKTFSKPKFWPW